MTYLLICQTEYLEDALPSREYFSKFRDYESALAEAREFCSDYDRSERKKYMIINLTKAVEKFLPKAIEKFLG